MNQHAGIKPDWTALTVEQRSAALQPLLLDGLTAAELAGRFDSASRNAIIGHCRRNKLRLISGDAGGLAPRIDAADKATALDRQRQASERTAKLKGQAAAGKQRRYHIGNGPPTAMPAGSDGHRRNGPAFDPANAPADARRKTIETIARNECRWPMFRDDDEMLLCGAKVETDARQPYCRHHQHLNRRPPGDRGRV